MSIGLTLDDDPRPASPRWRPGPALCDSPTVPVGVVLAAGRSQRLSSRANGHSKALLRLGGVSLIEHAVNALRRAGVGRVVVVVGFEADDVAARLTGLGVEIVRAQGWEAGNGASLAAARDLVGEEEQFVLMCGDHLFADGALDDLARSTTAAVLVDSAPDPAVWEEGTRVLIDGGKATAFSKDADAPAVDCGVFVLPHAVFAAQQAAAAGGDNSLAAAVTGLAAQTPIAAVPLRAGAWWQDVDTPEDLKAARRSMRRSLGKPSDGPVSRRLNRPISTRITMAAAPFRVPPPAFSLVTLLIGMWAAWSLSAGRALVGAALLHAASVLDGSDGETARLQGTASRRGALIDRFIDRTVDGAAFAALALWALDATSVGIRIAVLGAAATGFGIAATRVMGHLDVFEMAKEDEPRLNALLGGRDARMLILALGAAAGLPLVALAAAAATYAAKASWRVVHVLGERRRAAHLVAVPDTGPAAAVPQRRLRSGAPSLAAVMRVMRFLLLPAVVVAAFTLVLPRFVDLHEVWALITSLSWKANVLLLLLTAWNLTTYWPLRTLSMPGLSLKQAAVVSQSSTAVAMTVPAGGALGVGVSYAMYASWGFGPAAIASSTLATFVVGTLVKLFIPAVALVALAMQGEHVTGLVSAALTGAVALALAVAILAVLLWREGAARRIGAALGRVANLCRRCLGRTPSAAWADRAAAFRSRLAGLLRNRGLALSAAALVSQLSVFAVMVATMRFSGIAEVEVAWAEALAVFASVRLASAVPILPGNVGFAEFGYIGGLVLAGGDVTEAVAAVLLFRFLTFFIQIPIGGATFLMWQRRTRRRTMEPSTA